MITAEIPAKMKAQEINAVSEQGVDSNPCLASLVVVASLMRYAILLLG